MFVPPGSSEGLLGLLWPKVTEFAAGIHKNGDPTRILRGVVVIVAAQIEFAAGIWVCLFFQSQIMQKFHDYIFFLGNIAVITDNCNPNCRKCFIIINIYD